MKWMKHVALATALVLSAPVGAYADTPADQLIVGLSMNNILTLDPAAISGREATGVIANLYDTLVELAPDKKTVNPGLASAWTVADDGSILSLIHI